MDWWRKRAVERRAQIAKFFKGPKKEAKKPEGQVALNALVFHKWGSSGNWIRPGFIEKPTPKAFDSGRGFIEALTKRGWEILGRGHFSTVVAKKDSNKVLKVGKNLIDQDGWIDYALWAARKGYAGTFAPKVYSFKRIKGYKEDFTLSVVERLDRTIYGAHNAEQTVIPNVIDYFMHRDNPLAGRMLELASPGMTKFIQDLKSEFKGHFDLHSGNYMLRKDGSFVFSDPISGKKPKTGKRLRLTDFTAANDNLKVAA